MKEVCGFIDKRGVFHKTQKECEIAEIQIKIENTRYLLDNFEQTVSDYIFRDSGITRLVGFNNHKVDIFNKIAEKVLRDSDKFIAIINEKKNLAKDLDKLEAQYREETFKPWWLRVKWWN